MNTAPVAKPIHANIVPNHLPKIKPAVSIIGIAKPKRSVQTIVKKVNIIKVKI